LPAGSNAPGIDAERVVAAALAAAARDLRRVDALPPYVVYHSRRRADHSWHEDTLTRRKFLAWLRSACARRNARADSDGNVAAKPLPSNAEPTARWTNAIALCISSRRRKPPGMMHDACLFLVRGGLPQEADDATLVHQLIDRHPHAARVIWERFAPMVHGMLRRSLGPDNGVEDLAQEVFIHVFQKASTLRNPQALKAFVIAVTTFTVRNELRTRWSRRCLRQQHPVTSPGQLVTYQDIESREALRRLCLILDRANAQERTAFVLHVIEGMPLEDVASALDVSVATAKRRVSRAWHRVVLFAERDAALTEYLSSLERDEACA
jgi:RNA polymerase sigma-70 factor, ECF subfamily